MVSDDVTPSGDWITDYDEIVSQSSEEHDRRLTSTEAHLNKAQLFNMFQKILGVSGIFHCDS